MPRAPAAAGPHFTPAGKAPAICACAATLSGLDVAIRTEKKQARADRVAPLVSRFKLARLALNGEMVLQAQPPMVAMGKAQVELPIGSFLQATEAAENILADYVLTAVGKAKTVADLFCGIGPFALRLAEQRPIFAADRRHGGL